MIAVVHLRNVSLAPGAVRKIVNNYYDIHNMSVANYYLPQRVREPAMHLP